MKGLPKPVKAFSLVCLTLGIVAAANANALPPKPILLNKSKQLIVVVTDSWDNFQGQLQLYERNSTKQPWHATGKSWPIVVGKNGLAWADNLKTYAGSEEPMKKEGDNKAPAGAFKINLAFGFSPSSDSPFNFPYLAITPSIICVDDVKSKYYGKIIDTSEVTKDWNSAELMSEIPVYKKGFVVDYNTDGKMLGAGSCIFIHIKGETTAAGTAGCTAMEFSYLSNLWDWINHKANPVLVQLPKDQYLKLKSSWGLPPLPKTSA